jgi:purine nucleosidase
MMNRELYKQFQKPIFLDHNGFVDDIIALTSLLSLSEYRISGIAISNDPLNKPGIEMSQQVLELFCRHDIEIALYDPTPIHTFTKERGKRSKDQKTPTVLSKHNGKNIKINETDNADFTALKLLNEKEKTTIVITGSATNIAYTLLKYPEAKLKIDKILWVAGAFRADGNVIAPDHDGSAEWNIYCNPVAASELFNSDIPIYLFPLDSSEQVPVDKYLLHHLEKNSAAQLSHLAFDLLNSQTLINSKCNLSALLPSLYLESTENYKIETESVNIEQRGTSKGNIYKANQGSNIRFVHLNDDMEFYDQLIHQLQQF